MRLIDADALKDYIKIWNVGEGIGDNHAEILKTVDRQPTIDATLVVHGEWMKTFRYMRENINTVKLEPIYSYDCPICKYHTGNQGKNFNFCPNCGAKMDGKEIKEQ